MSRRFRPILRQASRSYNVVHLRNLPILLLIVGLVDADRVCPDVVYIPQGLQLPQSLEEVLCNVENVVFLACGTSEVLGEKQRSSHAGISPCVRQGDVWRIRLQGKVINSVRTDVSNGTT